MSKNLLKIAALALALSAGIAQADPVLLTVSKDYGNAAGQTKANYTSGSSCIQADSIAIYDSTACGNGVRFYDSFNFAAIGATAVSSLQLTLTFSATNNINNFLGFIPVAEDWKVRPGSSASNFDSGYLQFDLVSSGDVYTQTFTFTAANLALFSTITTNKVLGLGFAEEAWGTNYFNLYSAKLDVIGVAPTATVPEPSALALAGLALFGLGMSRRRSAR